MAKKVAPAINHKINLNNLKKDSVGHKITTKVPLTTPEATLADVRLYLFNRPHDLDTINYIYVVSPKQKLLGVFSIREVFKNKPTTQVSAIMKRSPHTAHPNTDQERVAHLALKHNLKAIPIVNHHDELLGVIPSDAILSILNHETKEDLLQIAGIVADEATLGITSDIPVLTSFLHRIPWIVIGLVGGLLTAQIIDTFSATLEQNLILAAFIPLVAYLANAVGTQTQTIFIRDLSTRKNLPLARYTLKQFANSLLIGITCWLIIAGLASFSWQAGYLGFIIGLAIFVTINAATFFALSIPLLLKKLNQDPAIGSGPFTAITQDFFSVVIYFAIASLLL